VWDVYPIPHIEQILEALHGKELFTALDIQWGYNNIWIREEDQWKAAFKTPDGLFKPRVMFFRLMNSPTMF
jgi:Reverse transcriptase (RNA-dependent DNA polymerase)